MPGTAQRVERVVEEEETGVWWFWWWSRRLIRSLEVAPVLFVVTAGGVVGLAATHALVPALVLALAPADEYPTTPAWREKVEEERAVEEAEAVEAVDRERTRCRLTAEDETRQRPVLVRDRASREEASMLRGRDGEVGQDPGRRPNRESKNQASSGSRGVKSEEDERSVWSYSHHLAGQGYLGAFHHYIYMDYDRRMLSWPGFHMQS